MTKTLIGGHEHYLSHVDHYDGLECDACDRSYGDAYSCDKCKFTVHEKCYFLFHIREIFDHPSHDGHRLEFLTAGAPDHTNPKCHLCDKNTKRLLYHCSSCKLNVDIDCMADAMCARAHLNMPGHNHSIIRHDFKYQMRCDFCYDFVGENGYLCLRSRLVIHEECISVLESPEITHHSHVRHPLKLITNGAPDYTDGRCDICGDNAGNLLYHCDICKFNLDMICATRKPPPAALSNLKVHEHTLTLMPKLISFVCDACGTKGDRAPYVCVQCDFMIFHQKCVRLPRVIHVNHHDHRVSFKYTLSPGEWKCGVCWEEINWSYGAYSCSLCPRYAIHSLCATSKDVWDGEELDGVLEEVEDIEPFKTNDDNTITHFAHEHNLNSLNKDGEDNSLCGGCVRPIGSYTYYKCSETYCSFILHETCADLPKKKRHFLSPKPLELDLLPFDSHYYDNRCQACRQVLCEGFIYSTHHDYILKTFDLLCGSITVPFIHESHDHHLLYQKLAYDDVKICRSCGIRHHSTIVLGCKKCNYFLDFRCATLPLSVTLPRYDDHPLTLCYDDEKGSSKYWCDICERETNPKNWFYTCKDCGVTLHVLCVVGDIKYAKPGGKITISIKRNWYDIELLSNNSSSRPRCNRCHRRCPGPFIINKGRSNVSFCSYNCLRLGLRRMYLKEASKGN